MFILLFASNTRCLYFLFLFWPVWEEWSVTFTAVKTLWYCPKAFVIRTYYVLCGLLTLLYYGIRKPIIYFALNTLVLLFQKKPLLLGRDYAILISKCIWVLCNRYLVWEMFSMHKKFLRRTNIPDTRIHKFINRNMFS